MDQDMRRVPVALTHKRTYENFACSNTDHNWKITPPYGLERWYPNPKP
jgi:hypothetical protein